MLTLLLLTLLLALLLHLLLHLLHGLLGLLILSHQLLMELLEFPHIVRPEDVRVDRNLLAGLNRPLGVSPIQYRPEQGHQLERLRHGHPEPWRGVRVEELLPVLGLPHEPRGSREECRTLFGDIVERLLVFPGLLDLTEPPGHYRP